MSKRWSLDDDRFLVRYHAIGADYVASHDLGFKSKGAGTARIAKLKEAGVFDKIVAHLKAETEMLCAHTIAFGPEWAKDIAEIELRELSDAPL